MLDGGALAAAMRGADIVFHLAANADVRFGTEHPQQGSGAEHDRDLQRARGDAGNGVKRIAFSSTGSIYGEPTVFPTPEDAPFPVQTSLYGASKLAGEGLISAYCEGFGFQGYIFRFVSILGERYTHGHVFDFYKRLRGRPDAAARARQRQAAQVVPLRPGLHRRDPHWRSSAPRARSTSSTSAPTSTARSTTRSAGSRARSASPRALTYTGGERGWIGDSPFIFLDCARMRRSAGRRS